VLIPVGGLGLHKFAGIGSHVTVVGMGGVELQLLQLPYADDPQLLLTVVGMGGVKLQLYADDPQLLYTVD
jgi:hypothetical protein